jgi:hypothetical protein
MIDLHVRGRPGEEPGAPPRTRRRLPLRIAEVREVQAPPAPTPLPGYLCEQCLDAPAVLVVPAPEGGDMGICAACQQAAAVAALPVLTAAAGQQTLWHPIRDADSAGSVSGCRRGALASVVGSLRRDRASPGLPVWGLSVALGRRRSDVTPAVVGQQARSIGPLRRVGWHVRGCTGRHRAHGACRIDSWGRSVTAPRTSTPRGRG